MNFDLSGQTPHPISTIFNRLLEGTIPDMLTKNEDAALKTVDCRMVTDRHTHTHRQTDRHTHRQTDRQTDRHTHTDRQTELIT